MPPEGSADDDSDQIGLPDEQEACAPADLFRLPVENLPEE